MENTDLLLTIIAAVVVVGITVAAVFLPDEEVDSKHKCKDWRFYNCNGAILRACKRCGKLQRLVPDPMTGKHFWTNSPEYQPKHAEKYFHEDYPRKRI